MKYFLSLSFLFLIGLLSAQSAYHQCGVNHEMDAQVKERLLANRAWAANNVVPRMDEIYVPVNFWRVGFDDGTGKIRITDILDQLCKLNLDYSDTRFIFYLNNILELDNEDVFLDPASYGAFLGSQKNGEGSDGVNIFVCQNAGTGGIGTTLGYYSPNFDFIVMRKQELPAPSSGTLTHEMGHFLSLPHPFFGWEGLPYDPDVHGNPCSVNTAELVNGSNCNFAGDGICDTPPDYLFSFSPMSCVSGCNFECEIYDRNNDQIFPHEENVMSYFDNCSVFEFTTDQENAMYDDQASPSRAYIRSDYVPDTNMVATNWVVNSPTIAQKYDNYNSVLFDWEDLDNASNYLVTISGSSNHEIIVEQSELFMTDLLPNGFYTFGVRAYNQVSSCSVFTPAANLIFTTGDLETSNNNISEVDHISIYPNPVRNGSTLTISLDLNTNIAMTTSVFNTTQSTAISIKQNDFHSGLNNIELDVDGFPAGMYLIKFDAGDKQIVKRVVVTH